jgi:UDP-N-acetylmuramoylalanine--D-glutamate ligase
MKKIVILGGGESGVGAALLAKKNGYTVFVSDKKEIKPQYRKKLVSNEIDFEENQHSEEIILNADIIIRSPGISKNTPILNQIKKRKNIELISEIEWASRFTQAKIIAITGTNGKTTTASLIYHILFNAGWNVGLGGNIGNSFSELVLENNYDYLVIEVSNFQLEDIKTFKPFISVLLNITPDHLDQYNYEFEAYAKNKFKIKENQTKNDFFVYNFDDETIKNMMKTIDKEAFEVGFSLSENNKTKTFADTKNIQVNFPTSIEIPISSLPLIGKHNLYNSMAAATAANILKVKKENIRSGLASFEAVEHRLEKVLTIQGVDFINDSKATNINSTYYALEGMTAKTIWIVGGQDKGNNYDELLDLAKKKVKAIVCLGLDNSKIVKAFKNTIDIIIETHNMKDAVNAAYNLGEKGDVVLLSPCCASFDLFENYEDRGTQFKQMVKNL